jgi:hypothetical protein
MEFGRGQTAAGGNSLLAEGRINVKSFQSHAQSQDSVDYILKANLLLMASEVSAKWLLSALRLFGFFFSPVDFSLSPEYPVSL